MKIIGLSVSIKKKYEDEKVVIYNYGQLDYELGEFSVDKKSLEVQHNKTTEDSIDNVMYLVSVSKIIKLLKKNESLPEVSSYDS